jgi:hypothetical protein
MIGRTRCELVLTKGRKRDALEAYFKMPVAEFGGVGQHDRGPIAVRVVSIVGVAMMVPVIVVMIVIVMVA